MGRAVALAVLVGWLGTACQDEPQLIWRIELADPALMDRVAAIEAEIQAGTCQEPGAGTFSFRYEREAMVRPDIPALAAGTHAFRAAAVDGSCRRFATDCETVEVSREGTATVRSVLEQVPEVSVCAECEGGECLVPDDETPAPPPTNGVPTPEVLFPWNGLATGASLRPTFIWSAVAASVDGDRVVRYELEVDTSCEPAFPGCELSAPTVFTVDPTVETVRFRPDEPFDPGAGAPVGTRYYWRVRACTAEVCSAASPLRYLDVGRSPMDFDGDGDADVAVGSDATAGAAIFVFPGGPDGPAATPTWTASSGSAASPEVTLASAGDVNADGYADLVVGFPGEQRALLFNGSPTGLSSEGTVLRPPDGVDGGFGAAVAGVGDFDGDGYADVVVGAPASVPPRAHLFLGGPDMDGVADVALVEGGEAPVAFGSAIAGSCDVNGDGLTDVVLGAPGGGEEGIVHVFHGRSDGFAELHALDILALSGSLSEDGDSFGAAVACGDVLPGLDGQVDGFADVLVGAPGSTDAQCGRVFVFRGGAPGDDRRGVLREPVGPFFLKDEACEGVRFGSSLAVIDLDGDGDSDWVGGAPHFSGGGEKTGAAATFLQTPDGLGRAQRLTLESSRVRAFLGASVSGIGAADGTGAAFVALGAPARDANTGVAMVYRYDGTELAPSLTLDCPAVGGDAWCASALAP